MSNAIHNIAVIGAGISGVCSAAHLLRQGRSVTVYERSSVAGGIWHFDNRVPHESYPSEIPSHGDYDRVKLSDEDVYRTPPATPPHSPQFQHDGQKSGSDNQIEDAAHMSIAHAPPGPCYSGLKNNVPLKAMKTSLGEWPAELQQTTTYHHIEAYIQEVARSHNVESVTKYNTRVEDVCKTAEIWRICTSTLVEKPESMLPQLETTVAYFDAVVVTTGHYHMPRVPDITGLKDLKELYPDRIQHSKGYRNPDKYRDANVLIIGAGVSSMDIAFEIGNVGAQIYQSSRGGRFDSPDFALPKTGQRVSGIRELIFEEDNTANMKDITQANEQSFSHNESHLLTPLPTKVNLTDGTTLQNIHYIILATGYVESYPFLPDKHADNIPATDATPTTLVTKEGEMTHNLYKDIFYIPDPTLSFVGIPYHVATSSLFDFQAQVVARVYAGIARLPSTSEMREVYKACIEKKGLGKTAHSYRMPGAEIAYVNELVSWVNKDLDESGKGGEPMHGHTKEWIDAYETQIEMLKEKFGDWFERFTS